MSVTLRESLLLTSFPNRRAETVDARGLVVGLSTEARFGGGNGEISMGTPYSLSGVKSTWFLGGEESETLEAKESSRSEERKASSSSWRACRARRREDIEGTTRKGNALTADMTRSSTAFMSLTVECVAGRAVPSKIDSRCGFLFVPA